MLHFALRVFVLIQKNLTKGCGFEMSVSKGIGITERGDAGLDFWWVKKIDNHRFNILITKNLNDEFIDLVKSRDNIIVHATITGYGGSKLEPLPAW